MVFLCATGAIASASCSSERDADPGASEPDASFDASRPNEDEDADAASIPDAAPFDGGLLPIECASPPCATALVAGQDESFCALLHDGTVACWGDNQVGQLGRGEASPGSATPTRVPGLTDIVALDRTCAVDKAGAAFCWGKGPYRAADAGVTTELEPVRLEIPAAKKVSASDRTACALVDSGVLCWGSNASGQVTSDEPSDAMYPPTAIALGPGAPIRDLTVNEATFIVREDGASESWGANLLLARESSLSPDPNPRATMFERLTAVDVAETRACVAAGGDAYCWGDDVGAIPRRVVTPEPVVQVATTKSIRSVYPSKVVNPARWCAVSASGSVYCFGNNTSGQAGDGTKEHAARPARVAGLPVPAARVKTTYDATCALLTNGKIYCVGSNYYGQLGNGIMRRSSLEPVEVRLP
ncbi:MAG: hypothetical protein BGO98_25710 [Myxococcales bacterium 68-20]|nr:MAG: hypothetical protein BGO98_25710 [Myxococcales bacterium 68-20]